MKIWAMVGRIFFVAVTGAFIIVAGGGIAFIQRPIGIAYLVFSLLWWSLAMMRRHGAASTYDRKQHTIVIALGIVTVPLLMLAPPWEYAHFAGPIPRDGPLAYAGLTLFAAGISLQAAAMRALGDFYTVRLGRQPGHRLVTSGPYRLIRHPGYLSYLLSMIGIGLALSSLIGLGLVVLVIPFMLWRIKREEKMLVAEFSNEYQLYMKKTKWLLVPLVY